MPGKFLIDVTDERFKTAANADVIEFVRRANPFAHSDVGSLLIELGEELPGAHEYCPSYKSLAYVVLHTDADRIFAIAFGQRALAFRVAAPSHAEAVADGGTPAPEIGSDWVRFEPWDARGQTGTRERLRRWCARAYADATA
jgi:hypothetical protein